MSISSGLSSLLLLSSALVAPSLACAQAAPADPAQATPPTAPAKEGAPAPDASDLQNADAAAQAEAPDVSIPGGGNDIVVTGRRNSNIARSSSQVVSVLSSADIARTGEGDIAGSLSRVTGLSVVGNGFVYVRGLGDRYSLALLNGSPLPSPEPLKRVVPLDIFPTSVIASSLVQKSYSANFPGEFGGGVINLTTKSVPKEGFLTVGSSIGVDSATTGQLGYTYFGSASDFTGFDNGARDLTPALRDFFNSGEQIGNPGVDTQAIASGIVTSRNALVQRNGALPPNWSANLTGGKSFEVGGDLTLGIIATAGYNNKWKTRDTTQQTANALDLSSTNFDFERVITDNRIVVNGLLGLSAEFGRNKVRLTNLFIRDTIKEARIGLGSRNRDNSGVTFSTQDTAFFARQLFNTQLVGEFKIGEKLSLDVRGGYALSRRDSPYELSFTYSRSNSPSDPFGQVFTNTLNTGQRPGNASATFSKLNETLWSGGIDLSYQILPTLTGTVGYAISDTDRTTSRRSLGFQGNNSLDIPSGSGAGVALLRPDLLLQPAIIDFFDISLVDLDGGNPTYLARLRTHGAYGQIQAQITPALSFNAGVRFESGNQTVNPVAVYTVFPPSLPPATRISRDYFLPAGTITYQITPEMQFRLSGSETIARPQFRELVFQTYYDPDTNTAYQGNPLLEDSQLYNGEARWEWYFAREQRVAVAGFYKRINNPIETYVDDNGNALVTRFANAPNADLYGVELETQKYFDLSSLVKGRLFATRRAVAIVNYTYTKSRINVRPNDGVRAFPLSVTQANQLFRDGTSLTGQSDHLVNAEFGLENTGRLSQQTFLLSYASNRVTRRGPSGQPDIFEIPGFKLDFVARQGVRIAGIETEMKLEIRNITGTRYQELQQNGANRIFYNRYDVGTTANFGLSVNF